MNARFLNGWRIGASLPLLLLASAAAAAASCGSPMDSETGAGGSGAAANAAASVGAGPTTSAVSTGSSTNACASVGGSLGFSPASVCKCCHESIYNDWAASMHARSLKSPVAVAQMNQSFALDLKDKAAPDPQRLCVQCHSPIAAAFAGAQVKLPFQQEGDIFPDRLTTGVDCTTCHAYTGTPVAGSAGHSDFLNDFDASGLTFYGPIANPVDSPMHQSKKGGVLGNAPETLCVSCHNVLLDVNQDGKIVAGEDFILQNTSFEHDEIYRKQRDETCIDCHMPDKPSAPAVDGLGAPPDAPSRELHNHSFVGADAPLDKAGGDPQLALRKALLEQAAQLEILDAQVAGGQVSFSVRVTNVKAGHSLPTGFGFLRQVWVEVRVLDKASNAELGTSGVLKAPDDDLCDGNTLSDALAAQVVGCLVPSVADPQLVNFQTKLVTDVDPAIVNGVTVAVQAPGATETWAAFLKGGAVARARPVDQANLGPLAPFESRSFGYSFALPPNAGQVAVKAALHFRSLPPYLLRTLAQKELNLAPLLTQALGELKVIPMASAALDL